MRNNFVTNQFNRTNLRGCSLESIQHDLAIKNKNCEQGTEGAHTAKKT